MQIKNIFLLMMIFIDNMHSSGSYQYPTNIQLRMMKRYNSLPIIRTKAMYNLNNESSYDEYVYRKWKRLLGNINNTNKSNSV